MPTKEQPLVSDEQTKRRLSLRLYELRESLRDRTTYAEDAFLDECVAWAQEGETTRETLRSDVSRLLREREELVKALQTLIDNPPRVHHQIQYHMPTVEAKAILFRIKAKEPI